MTDPQTGDRVRTTADYAAAFSGRARTGVLMRRLQRGLIRVLVDGHQTLTTYHERFWERDTASVDVTRLTIPAGWDHWTCDGRVFRRHDGRIEEWTEDAWHPLT